MERELELAALGRGLGDAVSARLARTVLPPLDGVIGRPSALWSLSALWAASRERQLTHVTVSDLALLADRPGLITLDFSSTASEAARTGSLASRLGGGGLRELPAEEGEEGVDGDLRRSGSHG